MTRETLFEYAKKKYNTNSEYLWMKSPDNAVLRNSENNKWYGIVMDVKRETLGLKGEGFTDLLNVKCSPEKIEMLLQNDYFLPAYHMNKKHWISIIIESDIPDNIVFNLLDDSYSLTSL